jgi:hypothetical protein
MKHSYSKKKQVSLKTKRSPHRSTKIPDHRNVEFSLNRDIYDTKGNRIEGTKIFYRTPRMVYYKVTFDSIKKRGSKRSTKKLSKNSRR